MALREIGAKITLDGEAEWRSQMQSVNRELKTVKSELAANSAQFAGCANSAEALRAKQALLQTQYAQQKEKVRALTQALEDMEAAGEGSSKKADDMRVSLNYAKAACSNTSRELDDLSGYLAEAERSSDGCASSIDGFGKKVSDSDTKSSSLTDALSELVPGFSNVAGVLSGSMGTVALLGGAAAGLGAAYSWAMNLVEQTEELRTSLAKLNATAETLGVSIDEDLNESLVDLYAIADGDWDSAFEALQNLLNAGYDEELPDIITLLAGAVESFPDTLKIESLADSLQETFATGSATGQFAELLDRLGVDVDLFNGRLSACTTTAQKQSLVFTWLSEHGLADVAAAYEDANGEALALSEAEAELELANADLAESFVPLKTKITETKTELAGFLANVLEGTSHGGMFTALTVALQSGAAAGDECGVSMSELWDIMDEGGYTFETLREEANAAGMNMGEYINTLRDTEEASGDVAASTYDASVALEDQAVAVEDAMAELDELEALYEGLRSGVDSAVSGFNSMTDATANYQTTSSDMLAALQSQIDYMATYKKNLLAAAELGLSDALIAELSDGSAESAAYLQAIVDGGATAVADLNAKFAEVDTGKTALVDTFAELSPEVQEKMDEVNSLMDDAVSDWNKSEEAKTAGTMTIWGLKYGIQSQIPSLISQGRLAGQAFLNAYRSASNGGTVSSGYSSGGSASVGAHSHKTGLDYVPYDGYLAQLHYGERVLTAEENRAYSNNSYATTNLGGVAITVNAAPGQSAREIAQEVSREIRDAAERANANFGRAYI